jgi:hypothetical protein
MTSCRLFGTKLSCLAFCLLALLFGAAAPASAQAPQAISAVDVATSWAFALKRGDAGMLERTSAYPLELRFQKAPCSCKDGKARDARQLASLLSELSKSEDVKALEVTSRGAKEIPKSSLPAWAKRWSKSLPKGARLVLIEASGGAVYTLTFVVVVTGNQVRAVWLNAATDGDA